MKYLKLFEQFDLDEDEEDEEDDLFLRIDNSKKRGYHVVVFNYDKDDNEIIADLPEVKSPHNSFQRIHDVMVYADNLENKYPQISKTINVVSNQKRSLLDQKKR